MDHVFQLTDVYGPRLTNSPGFFAAADWVVKQLKEWGIEGRRGKMGSVWTRLDLYALFGEPDRAAIRAVDRLSAGLVAGDQWCW